MCLAQGHTTVTPVRLEPAAPRSRVKHSTTEPLRSHNLYMFTTQKYSYLNVREPKIVFMNDVHVRCMFVPAKQTK